MAKGILNPWVEDSSPQEEKEDLFEETPFKLNRVFEGRSYKIIISTPVKYKGESLEIINSRANKILGLLLQTFNSNNSIFKKLLVDQQIFFNDIPVINKIIFDLGNIKLYVTASSLDPELSKKMFIDRLVLALRELCKQDKIAKETMNKAKVQTINVQ